MQVVRMLQKSTKTWMVERSIVRKSDVASDLALSNEFTNEAFGLVRVEEQRVKHHDFSQMRESPLHWVESLR